MRVVSTEKVVEEITNWPQEKRQQVKFARIENVDGVEKVFAVYPKGTEFFGAQAEQLLQLGKAKLVEENLPRIEQQEAAK